MSDASGPVAAVDAAPLDTTLVVLTPENVAFQFRLAGPALRAMALFLDGLVIAVLGLGVVVTAVLLGFAVDAPVGLMLVALFAVWWGYGAVLEAVNNGQTLGKSVLGLRVVSRTGLSINAAQAVLRNLIRAVDAAPPFFPGAFAMAASRHFQRLGDLAAGTVVVLERGRRHVPPTDPDLPDPPWIDATVPPAFTAGPALAEALAAYMGRRDALSPARRTELADLLAARLCAAWEAPPPRDPDALVRAVYARAVAAGGEGA